MSRCAQVFDHIGVQHTNIDVINAEQLWVADEDRLEAGGEERGFVGRLGQWVNVMDLTG